MNLGDIVEVHCDFDGHPIKKPEDCSFTIKRKFKIIGQNKKLNQYLLELHYSSPFGRKASVLDLRNFELFKHIDSTDLPLLKVCIIDESALVQKRPPPAEGRTCMHCDDYYPYVGSNRKDGKFLCYSCRTSIGGRYPDL